MSAYRFSLSIIGLSSSKHHHFPVYTTIFPPSTLSTFYLSFNHPLSLAFDPFSQPLNQSLLHSYPLPTCIERETCTFRLDKGECDFAVMGKVWEQNRANRKDHRQWTPASRPVWVWWRWRCVRWPDSPSPPWSSWKKRKAKNICIQYNMMQRSESYYHHHIPMVRLQNSCIILYKTEPKASSTGTPYVLNYGHLSYASQPFHQFYTATTYWNKYYKYIIKKYHSSIISHHIKGK